jgi:hypothetical protein
MPKQDDQPVTHGRCLCGAVEWAFHGEIPDATICNCKACRRYGVLWAYGHDGVDIHVTAPENGIVSYKRSDRSPLTFNFCRTCGNVVSWRGLTAEDDGRVRIAVNLRLAEPEAVAAIPLQCFEGLHSFDDLPRDGRSVGDVWF